MVGKKKKPRFQQPDDVFSSGPFTVARFGTDVVFQSNFKPGEAEKFQKNLAEHYSEIVHEIDTLVSEIAVLIAELPAEKLLHRAWGEIAASQLILRSESETAMEDPIALRMLDYVQSVIAGVPPAHTQRQEVTEEEWAALRKKVGALFQKVTVDYQLNRRAKNKAEDSNFNEAIDKFNYSSQIYWCYIRGKRYQVHAPDYLRQRFHPHSSVIQELFGLSSEQFVDALIEICNALSYGYMDAFDSMDDFRRDTLEALEKKIASQPDSSEQDLQEMMNEVVRENNWEERRDEVFGRLLGTDLFDIQKMTALPEKLLDELTWSPGEDIEFYAEGEFRGWPLRIWPVFKRPFIRVNGRYYCFDLYSLLDNIYRVMQRTILRLKPAYCETWNSIQKDLSENFPFEYFARILPGAKVLKPVYYRGKTEAGTTDWCETDGLLMYDDHLFVIEVKAGAFTYTPPATDIHAWLKSLDNLVLKPITQGKRFIKYLMSADKVPLFNEKHEQIGELCKSEIRHVTICAVTLDPFTEIAAQVQHLHKIGMDIGTEPVWSLSVDDLQIYADVFENPLLFLHYVEQRMCAFRSDVVRCNDEIDHLGLYLIHNHYSSHVEDIHSQSGAHIQFTGYSEDVDKFFHDRLLDPDTPCPLRQKMPARLFEIVQLLSQSAGAGRARVASYLLDLNDDSRRNISDFIDTELANQQATKQARPFSTHGNNINLTVFCWKAGCVTRDATQALENARSILLINNDSERLLLELTFADNCMLEDVSWHWVDLSGIPRHALPRLQARAERFRRDRVNKARVQKRKIGRNEPCPCGSGQKYKKCCIGR